MRVPWETAYQVFDLIFVGSGADTNFRTRVCGCTSRIYGISPRYHLFCLIFETTSRNSVNETLSQLERWLYVERTIPF